jgi:hypothetical protein
LVAGRFFIIEQERAASICVRKQFRRLDVSGSFLKQACFTLVVAALAPLAGPANAAGIDFKAPRSAVQRQYHSQGGPQYHARGPGFLSLAPTKDEIAKLNLLITPSLISRISPSLFSTPSAMAVFRPRVRNGFQIERRTDPQIQSSTRRNTRLMLQIGALLGLIYVLFLATWVWATRFHLRLERSTRA